MSGAIDAREEFLHALAPEAGRLARDMRHDQGGLRAKAPMDYATEADLAVEALIRARIGARFADAVIGEEAGGAPGDPVWVVDPIDGTTNYIHGSPRWCVSIALLAAGRIELAAIHAPAEGRLFTARRGRGARLNGAPIRVSGLAHGASPVVELGWSRRRPIARFARLVQALIAQDIEFRRLGSGALGAADAACGANDGYLELHINAWDVLAGLLLVREAGGFTSDFLAGDGLRRGNPVLACTPELADRLGALMADG